MGERGFEVIPGVLLLRFTMRHVLGRRKGANGLMSFGHLVMVEYRIL